MCRPSGRTPRPASPPFRVRKLRAIWGEAAGAVARFAFYGLDLETTMRAALFLPFLLLAPPAPAQSTASDAACATVRIALPPELAAWGEQTPVSAGVKPGDGATVEVGKAALVSLHPAKHLEFTASGKPPAEANGGTLALAIAKAGTYRVALGGGAWIDLVHDGKPVAAKAHAHGPKCSGVAKMVDFTLSPGNYTVQLSRSSADTVALLVARAG